MKEKKLGPTVIRLLQGDITACEVDAVIVTADNAQLQMTSELGEAVKVIGGEGIEQEAVCQGPVEAGEIALTTGGRLKARYVIHAMSQVGHHLTNSTIIRSLIQKILILAEEQNFASIAIPSIGTGLGGFPVEQCADIMLDEICHFVESHHSLKKIIFVLQNQKCYKVFEQELDKI